MNLWSDASIEGNPARQYHDLLVPAMFRPLAAEMLDRVPPAKGDSVLDAACGTGIVATLAKQRVGDGRVVGIDASSFMLDVARSNKDIEWREADLEEPVDERFDHVYCQQGIQFTNDPNRAIANLAKAASQTFTINVWRGTGRNPLWQGVVDALTETGAPEPAQAIRTPFVFDDATTLVASMERHGFAVHAQTLTIRTTFQDAAAFATAAMTATPLAADVAQMDQETKEALHRSIADKASRFGEPVDAPAEAWLIAGRRDR